MSTRKTPESMEDTGREALLTLEVVLRQQAVII
jgi:hypothetical protein